MTAPRVLILRAPGINRDEDAAAAIELAGGCPERVHVNRLVEGAARMADYAMLIIPGGFSYGDHLGAGKLLAIDLAHRLGEQIAAFVADGRPVFGICNGFQVLVKAGVLPALAVADQPQAQAETASVAADAALAGGRAAATLTDNRSGRFECRWVHLATDPASRCLFTQGIDRPIEVPVAHGEGRFLTAGPQTLAALRAGGQVALRYVADDGAPAQYPADPNGSDDGIAGVCNPAGNVLGLMPHPEDAILPTQHPRWTRQPWRTEGDGLALFRNAIRYARG
ncbi:MAG: phosphoribosylformylglycinamidine synthase I [Roseiflexaceae bacterium]